jgi:uncharacterized protein Usg
MQPQTTVFQLLAENFDDVIHSVRFFHHQLTESSFFLPLKPLLVEFRFFRDDPGSFL